MAGSTSAAKTLKDVKKYVTDFIGEWEGKFTKTVELYDKMRTGIASISAGVAQNLGAIKANLDINSDAIEQFDIFNQIWARMLIRMAERIVYLENGATLSPEEIKEKGREWFEATFKDLKEQVLHDRQAYMEARRAEMEATKAAEEQARQAEEQAKKEQSTAEETLRSAETSISTSGGQGSDPPPEAEIFGG